MLLYVDENGILQKREHNNFISDTIATDIGFIYIATQMLAGAQMAVFSTKTYPVITVTMNLYN